MKTGRRTLKKVLGLVLCLAMMLSIMVVGAGAAFADQDQIDTKHQEAVDACASLNIITGFANGKFVPNDNVTREQTAKMICVLLNGGKDPVLGAGSSSFSDVANDRWSCPYIESCVSQDIIVGIGGGKFAPAGKVTGSQLAKMLLVSLGFSPDHQKYSGSAWEVNVNTDASARGFYKDLEDINPSEPLTREHAAQMIWNALNAYEVEYKSVLSTDANGQLTSKTTVQDKVVGSNNDKITLLQDKYGITIPKGVLASVTKNANKDTYTVEVYMTRDDAINYWGNDDYADNWNAGFATFKDVDKDYSDLLGQQVKLMIQKPDKAGESSKVTGIYATDNNTTVTAQKGAMDDLGTNKATINGETYKPASTVTKVDTIGSRAQVAITKMEEVPVYFTPGTVYESVSSTVKAIADYQTLTMIDNDGDGKIDLAICTPITFAQIDTLTSEEVTVSYIPTPTGANAETSRTFDLEDDDINLYDNAAEDDYVIVTPGAYTVTGDTNVVKADMINGTVSATKGSDPVSKKIDGNWYDVVENTNELSNKLGLNKTFDAAVYGDYVFAADKDPGSANADDVLFVDAAAALTNGLALKDKKVEADVVFSDGSTDTVTISKVYTAAKAAQDESTKAAEFGADKLVNRMWMFEKDGNDYILTELYDNTAIGGEKESLSYDGYIAYTTPETKKNIEEGKVVGTPLRTEDDSIVFVKAYKGDDSEVKVMSGKTVAGWSDASGKGVSVEALWDKSNGYQYMQVGAIVISGTDTVPGSSNLHYGYVVSAPEISKSGSTSYTTITVWDGSQELTVTGKTDDMKSVAKGNFISYSDKTDEYIKIEEVKTLGNAERLTAFDADTVTGSVTGSKDLADEYTVIGVNVKDEKGVAGKLKTATGSTPNVVMFLDDGDVAAVFIASNNKMIPADQLLVYYEAGEVTYTSPRQEVIPVSFTAKNSTIKSGESFEITVTRNADSDWVAGQYTLTLKADDGSTTISGTGTATTDSKSFVINVSTADENDACAGLTFAPSAFAAGGGN